MTRANWPQMEVVTSIEREGMRCCSRSEADLRQINGSVSLISIRTQHLLLIVTSLIGCSRSLRRSSHSVYLHLLNVPLSANSEREWDMFIYSKQWTLCVQHPSVSLTHRPSQQSSPLHTSLVVAVRPGLIQPISSERDSDGGTCCVSCCPVSKCQQPQSMSATQ